MPADQTTDSFLDTIRRSQVIDEDLLRQRLEELEARGVQLDSSAAIADALVQDGTLTRWQADLLLRGKHRGFRLGSYLIQDVLGKGGMGTVYLAEHDTMRRRAAIKVLPPRIDDQSPLLQRFHREAQAVATLDHPNVVRAYELGQAKQGKSDIHYLVMEYVEGPSLQALIDEHGPLDFVEAADYLCQTADGLQHAHANGLIHRDIKPTNLIVDPNGVMKILDLGLARFSEESADASITTAHNETLLGTADYVAPEQALNSREVDARTDIYSLGCVAYFMLTGTAPFSEGSVAERLVAHQVREPPPLSGRRAEMPDDLAEIVGKMLAKDVDARYQTADEVRAALSEWLNSHGGSHVLHHPRTTSGSSASSSHGARVAQQGSTISGRSPLHDTTAPHVDEKGSTSVDEADKESDGRDIWSVPVVVAAGLLIVAVTFAGWKVLGVALNSASSETADTKQPAGTTPPDDPPVPKIGKTEEILKTEGGDPPPKPVVLTGFERWQQASKSLRNDPSVLLYLPFDNEPEQASEVINQATAGTQVTCD